MNIAILSSHNKNKIKEIKEILSKFEFDVITRDDAGLPHDEIEENGTTFEENSYIKAKSILDMIKSNMEYKRFENSPIIADDSGLMVDILDGEPGVYSARYAGENCTYEDNNKKLLGALSGIPTEKRTAKFVTVITIIYPDIKTAPSSATIVGDEAVLVARGECRGRICDTMRGEFGFGYDPLFIPDGYDKTFAEIDSEEKNRISHRAKALECMESMLERKYK